MSVLVDTFTGKISRQYNFSFLPAMPHFAGKSVTGRAIPMTFTGEKHRRHDFYR